MIPDAVVTLTNKETGATQKATTQGDGHYVLINVPPGVYDLTVTKKGFETAKISSEQVRVGKIGRAHV